MLATILLQAAPEVTELGQESISVFALLVKGGWIMIPLLILFTLMLFIAGDSWFTLRKMNAVDQGWFSKILELVRGGEYEKAFNMARRNNSALARISRAGLQNVDLPKEQVEQDMEVESRQVLARIDAPVGYLSMIASIAPMLGFLGTIFGVINIFIKVSLTNELSISSISDGLYQKMICSAIGLLIGIMAYCAYYFLNRNVDKMVATMDKGGNMLIKARFYGRSQKHTTVE